MLIYIFLGMVIFSFAFYQAEKNELFTMKIGRFDRIEEINIGSKFGVFIGGLLIWPIASIFILLVLLAKKE